MSKAIAMQNLCFLQIIEENKNKGVFFIKDTGLTGEMKQLPIKMFLFISFDSVRGKDKISIFKKAGFTS